MSDFPSFDQTQPIQAQQQPQALPSFDQTTEVPPTDLPDFDKTEPVGQDKYGTPGQQAIAGLEGAAQGLAGPLAPMAEKAMGVSGEDIAGRAEANPWTHHIAEAGAFAGSAALGIGEAGLLAKTIPKFTALGTIGSAALRGGLEMMALQGGDEITKAITVPDPTESTANLLANVAYAGIMGSATGGLFGLGGWAAKSGMKALEDSKFVDKAESFIAGAGAEKSGVKYDPFIKKTITEAGDSISDMSAYKQGQKFIANLPEMLAKHGTHAVVEGLGIKTGGPLGYVTAKAIEPVIDAVIQRPLTSASKKFVIPYVIKALSTDTVKSLPTTIEYALKAAQGAKKITAGLDSLFKAGTQQAFDASINQATKERINQNIEDEALDQQYQSQEQAQQFAEGGKVQASSNDENHFANSYPAETQLLQTSKARVYNHLKSLRPKPTPGMIYDKTEPSAESHRIYDKALDLATNPLSIIKEIKDGTLTSSEVIHMNSMWPELNDHLKKEMVKRMTRDPDKKPSYKVRHSLAVFLGQPVESFMTPMAIQSAQSVFLPKQPQQPGQSAGNKPKKDTAKLGGKTNKMYNTLSQEAETDRTTRQ